MAPTRISARMPSSAQRLAIVISRFVRPMTCAVPAAGACGLMVVGGVGGSAKGLSGVDGDGDPLAAIISDAVAYPAATPARRVRADDEQRRPREVAHSRGAPSAQCSNGRPGLTNPFLARGRGLGKGARSKLRGS